MADLATQIGKDILAAVGIAPSPTKLGNAAIRSILKNFDERIPLTRQELNCLRFIQKYYLDGGIMPSYEEMAVHIEVKSKSGIHRIITSLESHGAITRLPARARGIKLTRLGEITAQ